MDPAGLEDPAAADDDAQWPACRDLATEAAALGERGEKLPGPAGEDAQRQNEASQFFAEWFDGAMKVNVIAIASGPGGTAAGA